MELARPNQGILIGTCSAGRVGESVVDTTHSVTQRGESELLGSNRPLLILQERAEVVNLFLQLLRG